MESAERCNTKSQLRPNLKNKNKKLVTLAIFVTENYKLYEKKQKN